MHQTHDHGLRLILCLCDGAQDQSKAAFTSAELQKRRSSSSRVRRRTINDKLTHFKSGATEWIHWQSGTAQLLPRLIAGRTRGPLFLTGRKVPAGAATLDVCGETDRARLSYRRAEEIFEYATRLLANPLASPEDVANLEGFTLHRLRQCADVRRRARHVHADAADPLPPRLRTVPGTLRSSRRRRGRRARRRERPGCPPTGLSRNTHGVRRTTGLFGRHRSRSANIRCFRGRYYGDPISSRARRSCTCPGPACGSATSARAPTNSATTARPAPVSHGADAVVPHQASMSTSGPRTGDDNPPWAY